MSTSTTNPIDAQPGEPSRHRIDQGIRGGPEPAGGGGHRDGMAVTAVRASQSALKEMRIAEGTWDRIDALPTDGSVADCDILVVDDYPANVTVLRSVLMRRGHRVDFARNGIEALDQVQTAHYDLILMDVEMPRLDGIQATLAIRRLASPASHVPIVGLSAHAQPDDRQRCLDAGMNAFLSKPMAAEELVRTVERIASTHDDSGTTVDPAVLDLPTALQRLEGDRELLCEIALIFTDDAGRLLAELDEGLKSGDAMRAKLAAHSLKGLASNFGRACAAAAEIVEFAARDGRFDEALLNRPRLEHEVERLIAALRSAGLAPPQPGS